MLLLYTCVQQLPVSTCRDQAVLFITVVPAVVFTVTQETAVNAAAVFAVEPAGTCAEVGILYCRSQEQECNWY